MIKNIFILFLTFLSVHVYGNSFKISSTKYKTHLIELYSSEGCSSCPPADRWLSSLRNNKALWKIFIPIEFHVDYWDNLGWVDPFGNRSFSQRQRAYSKQWGVHKVATPGFILDGEHWPLGEQKKGLPVKQGSAIGILKVDSVKSSKFQVSFEPISKPKKQYIVYGALLGHGLKTKVPRGENSGSILKHEFVVLSLSQRPLFMKNKFYAANLSIADNKRAKAESYSLVFWVTEKGSLTPLQVVGQPIIKKDLF